MTIEILKDVTLTVKAGQSVEVDPEQAALVIKLGYAKAVKTAPKKAAKK